MTDHIMTFVQYQNAANKTASDPHPNDLYRYGLALCEEAGEVAGKIKRILRGDDPAPTYEEIAYELGDTLWYLTQLAQTIGYDLHEIAQLNIKKLEARQRKGSLKGTGDER